MTSTRKIVANTEYTSRRVAPGIKPHTRECLCAATPPLDADNIWLSFALTDGVGYNMKAGVHAKLDFIAVRKASVHAMAEKSLCVNLPLNYHPDGMCWRLNKAMYVTRDAVQNWEPEYIQFILESGFMKGKSTPCMFAHPEKNIRVTVHGDDVSYLGYDVESDLFRKLISNRYEVESRGRAGPDNKDSQSIRILGKVIEWGDRADQRHADIIARGVCLQDPNTVVTPGEDR